MKKIAISGKARSGKDTIARLIEEISGKNVFRFAAADCLKDVAKTMFPWLRQECLWGDSQYRDQILEELKEKTGGKFESTRDLVKDLARYFKEINPNIIVENLDWKLKGFKQNPYNWYHIMILTDIRFRDEFEWAKHNEFTTIRVIRPNLSLENKITQDSSEVCQEEISNDAFDWVIENDGDLEDLKKKIQPIVDKMFRVRCANTAAQLISI